MTEEIEQRIGRRANGEVVWIIRQLFNAKLVVGQEGSPWYRDGW